jgi:hypothetical protein
MDLIQPFINAADAVFAESLQGPRRLATCRWKKEPIGGRALRR